MQVLQVLVSMRQPERSSTALKKPGDSTIVGHVK